MDFIIIVGIGAILVATGVISPKPNEDDVVEAECEEYFVDMEG